MHRNLSEFADDDDEGERVLSAKTDTSADAMPVMEATSSLSSGGLLAIMQCIGRNKDNEEKAGTLRIQVCLHL